MPVIEDKTKRISVIEAHALLESAEAHFDEKMIPLTKLKALARSLYGACDERSMDRAAVLVLRTALRR